MLYGDSKSELEAEIEHPFGPKPDLALIEVKQPVGLFRLSYAELVAGLKIGM
jgi:hypothetical protein